MRTSRRYFLRASALLDRYEPIGLAPRDPDWAGGEVEQTLTTSNFYNASKLRQADPSLWQASDQRERFNVNIKANAAGALAGFDSAVLTALKETEQSLATYRSTLDYRQALTDAQSYAHRAFNMAHEQFLAGSVSNLDLLTTEQVLVAADAAVAASDSALIQDQIAVFKALGGGWRSGSAAARTGSLQ